MSRKSEQAHERRERLEAIRREQQAKERRRSLILIGGAILVSLAIIAVPAVLLFNDVRNDPANQDWAEIGVAASAASCQPVTEDETTGSSDHRDGEDITYETSPPSSGPHRSTPDALSRTWYAPGSDVEVEQIVHNLEHGYTVLWYDPEASDEELTDLEGLAGKVSTDEALAASVNGKFKVVPWDPDRGSFPEGMRFALSHWGSEQGARQYCGELSGEAVRDFVTAHPSTDSPEPFGA